ncbi:MAG TPA: hypothetical protein VFC99_00540 [Acidimicrobiia bacterium]|nr:hypothetical protein [Acidimicrobiia bacterium]
MTPPGAPRVGGPVDGGTGPGDPSRSGETGDPRAPALRAVGDTDAGTRGPGGDDAALVGPLRDRHGLALAYAVLDRIVEEHSLARAAVLVDDPDLGHQVLYDRARPLDDGDLALFDAIVAGDPADGPGHGLFTAPVLAPGTLDAELVTTLVATAVRVATLEATTAPGDPADVLEVAVRRLPGVGAVAVDPAAGVVQVVTRREPADGDAGPPAPADLAGRVVELAASFLDGAVAVEILRGGRGAGAAFGAPPARAVELVAVTNALDTQEIEVHVRRRDVRTIGRAPAAHGLAGGVEATIAALHALGLAVSAELEWARTIETTSQRRFVVGVALRDEHGDNHYGLAEGGTPVAAAAQAALDALGG